MLDRFGRDQDDAAPSAPTLTPNAQVALEHLAALEQLALASPADQALMIARARAAAEADPRIVNRLRHALLLSLPGSVASDPALARGMLQALLAEEPAMLLPAELMLARIALRHVDAQQALAAENQQLANAANRTERERTRDFNRRLQAQAAENAQLQKDLDEARAKLQAVAALERSLAERKPAEPAP